MLLSILLSACAGTASRSLDSPRAPTTDISAVTAIDPGSKLSAGWQHGAFIEIFVRAWRDSDGDGIGDLRGVTQSLDYLRDLGIKGIWLLPITQSADHDHGYAVTDFRTLEPAYGTLADFDELVREAHARGIGVIMDYVINHSATSHPLFVEAASRTSPDRDWYIWKEPAPTGWEIWGKNPWHGSSGGTYYGTFGPHMPDFNLENPAVIDYHRDSLKFWLNRGLDGFRFDAVSHLIERSATDWRDQPESFALMGRVNALMGSYKHRYMVCEGTANPISWAAPDACRSAFAFGLQYHIADAARGKPEAIRAVADYFTTAPMTMATMMSNHDFFAGERLWDQVNGSTAQYRLAAASYLLLPGTPFIYYGEEIGMAGVSELKGDIKLRTPMSWTADASGSGAFTTGKPFRPVSPNAATQNVRAALADPNSILSFYKAMLHLRNTLPSIARGSYEHPAVDGSVMSYQRKFEGDHTLVVINYGTAAAMAKIAALPIGATLVAAYPATALASTADAKGAASIAIDAQSVRVFSVRR
ncbi:MAG: alpha-amylase [Betaproteobacteria bacterium]|nr:alpha-amylase [Betaproteobacteria bacterium]